jgi:DNA primase large subunit
LSIKLGTNDLAKYPFLNEAALYVKETHFDLQEFDRREMDFIINRSFKKIEDFLKVGESNYNLEKFEVEILTFLASLLILKSVSVDVITKKFALLESMRFEKYLIDDLKNSFKDEKKRLLLFKIFKEVFKIDVYSETKISEFYKIRVIDYIRRSIVFHEQEWKLINRTVKGGYVYLTVTEVVRLFRNELSLIIVDKIKNMKLATFPNQVVNKSQYLKSYWESVNKRWSDSAGADDGFVNKNAVTPPCIDHLYKILNNGENLPHSARLLLATFLLFSGKSIEEIVEIFKKLPDFNERITRYQLEHLSGKKGGSKKYFVPSCEKIKLENLCYETEVCKGIINPIQLLRGRRSRGMDDNN